MLLSLSLAALGALALGGDAAGQSADPPEEAAETAPEEAAETPPEEAAETPPESSEQPRPETPTEEAPGEGEGSGEPVEGSGPALDEFDDISLDELVDESLEELGEESLEELEEQSLDADAESESDVAAQEAAAPKTVWKLSLEGGSEYDSNLHRVEVLEGEVGGVDSGPLMRSAARLQLAHPLGPGKLFTLNTVGTTKLFAVPEGQSENLGIIYGNARYQQRWGKSRAILGARGNYYEAFDIRPFGEGVDPVVGRSFRSTEGEVSLTLPSTGADRVSLVAGLRDFVYKPDADFNWYGEQLGLRYSNMFWLGDPDRDEEAASIDLRGEYRIGNRGYQGAAFRNTCSESAMVVPDCFVPTGERRSDLNHLLVVEGVYTGAHIFSLLYAAEITDSNSYGQASVRHRAELAVTTEAPGKIFVTGKAVVRFNRFTDPLLLARNVQSQTFVSIEDENRNSLSLDLARDFGAQWGLEARIALYSNEFATQVVSFRRQTAYLGALYRFGADGANP